MHDASKIGSFMALRANGWSLAKISKELNISKSTLWEWDNKQQNEIHLLKHLQLEKLQEKYLPTYEEELSKLRGYLDRLETALETQDFSKMGPEYVLQMALQLRARLGKMREQVPLRNVPFNEPLTPLPFTGCVTRQDAHSFREEYFQGESGEDAGSTNTEHSAPSPSASASSATSVSKNPELPDRVENPSEANRTFPDETPPGVKNGSLKTNGFHKPDPNGRPVFNSENLHLNGNGHPNGNGNGHPPIETDTSVPDSAVKPSQAGPFVPDGWELSDHVSETGVRLAFPKRTKQ